LDAIQKPTDQDIAAALDAIAVGDDVSSRLNYFIQVYRAGDFPAYEDYAIHRATEPFHLLDPDRLLLPSRIVDTIHKEKSTM
jgi:hypothetical protein